VEALTDVGKVEEAARNAVGPTWPHEGR
jgi:hypothetical protein